MNMVFKHSIVSAALALLAFWVGEAKAQSVQITQVPTAWRLENYPSSAADGVVLWFTGSSCTNGGIRLRPGASIKDQDRLYMTIALGKTAARKVFVRYSVENNACVIDSFGLIEE
jgi:hypothetical protein